jgi:hypothetical protein
MKRTRRPALLPVTGAYGAGRTSSRLSREEAVERLVLLTRELAARLP